MFGRSRPKMVWRLVWSWQSQAGTAISGLGEKADCLFGKETAFEPWFPRAETRSTASQESRRTLQATCFSASNGVCCLFLELRFRKSSKILQLGFTIRRSMYMMGCQERFNKQ